MASSRSPSSRSCEIATTPPAARSTAAIACASAAAAGPSVWIVSCAAPGVGGSSASSAWTAARDAASISSMIEGCDAGGGDGGGRGGRGAHIGEGRRDRADVARNQPPELQRRADDDAERALGADHRARSDRAPSHPSLCGDPAAAGARRRARGRRRGRRLARLRTSRTADRRHPWRCCRRQSRSHGWPDRAPTTGPARASEAFRSALMIPGSTTASRSSGRTSRIRSICRSERAISPVPAFAPPASPVPAPRVTTGLPVWVAMRSVACTSSTDAALTTASGAPDAAWPDLSASSQPAGQPASCRDDRRVPRAAARRRRPRRGVTPAGAGRRTRQR